MAAEIRENGSGFHKLVFKVDGGRNGMSNVTVMISQDAQRKLTTQLQRARFSSQEKGVLLKSWARWELGQRLEEAGVLPTTLTITASDLDDFGAYASDFGRSLQAS
jgi:hypothetical protein